MKITAHEIPFSFSHVGRSTEEEYERVEPIHQAFWDDESKLLEQFSFDQGGCSINVTIDWHPLRQRLKDNARIWGPLYRGGEPDMEAYRKLPKTVECSARVEVSGESEFAQYAWYPGHFLELALYDAFVVANLALPGALDLFGCRIPPQVPGTFPNDLKLSSYNFEFWWVESLRGKYPKLRQLPLKQVREWYALSGISGQSRAKSGLERAVFSLLHLCRSDNYVDGLIWVFHALEALLGTRIGDNVSGMLRRISLLTELNERERNALKRALKKAYDMRSSFVHGGYEIPHPVHSEVFDPSISSAYSEALGLQQFGMAVVLSLIQQLVQLRATKYHFREVFVPHVGAP